MSVISRRVPHFQSIDVLICATLVCSSGACARSPSAEPRPVVAALAGTAPRSTTDLIPVHFPGVDLVPLNHGAFAVRIHSGLVGDGAPLYVIDGRPTIVDPNHGIDWIRPEDVSRITVVKNPADLAIYGPRGVNGVVEITTKHGATPR